MVVINHTFKERKTGRFVYLSCIPYFFTSLLKNVEATEKEDGKPLPFSVLVR